MPDAIAGAAADARHLLLDISATPPPSRRPTLAMRRCSLDFRARFEGLVQDVRDFCDLVKLRREEGRGVEAGSRVTTAARGGVVRRTSRYDDRDAAVAHRPARALLGGPRLLIRRRLKCKKDLRRARRRRRRRDGGVQEEHLEVESDAQVQAHRRTWKAAIAVAEALTRALSRGDASTDEGEDNSLGTAPPLRPTRVVVLSARRRRKARRRSRRTRRAASRGRRRRRTSR